MTMLDDILIGFRRVLLDGDAQTARSGLNFSGGVTITDNESEDRLDIVFAEPSLSVTQFGAVGDGVTNDSTAVQACIAAVVAAGGGEVVFPAGEFSIAPFALSSVTGVKFRGVQGATAFYCRSTTADFITMTSCSYVEFEGIEVKCYVSGVQQARSAGAYFKISNSCSDIKFNNVTLNNPFDGIKVTSTTTKPHQLFFSNMYIVSDIATLNSAMYFEKCVGVHATNIVIATTELVTVGMLVVDGGVDTFDFSHCEIVQVGGGAGVPGIGGKAIVIRNTGADFDSRWGRFVAVYAEGAAGNAWDISDCNNVEMHGCYAATSLDGVAISGGSNIKFIGGVVCNMGHHGFNITGGENILISGVTISSCSLTTPNTYSGVMFNSTTTIDCRVTGNTIGESNTIPGDATLMAYGIAAIARGLAGYSLSFAGNYFGVQAPVNISRGILTAHYASHADDRTIIFNSEAAPTIVQEIVASTGTNNGENLSIAAQDGQLQTGGAANNNGGDLVLSAGLPGTGGGGAAGAYGSALFSSGTSRLTLAHAAANTLHMAAGVPSFTFDWANKTTNSGTGGQTTITGQNETGTTSTGGAIVLQSGTGTSAHGAIILNPGGAGAKIACNQTGLGFYGVTNVARAAAITQSYATASRTLAAYTSDPESAYTGIDNAQVGSVYGTVADLNALRVAYENLRVHHESLAQVVNSLIDDLQAYGLEQ